jgi:hypothetical protein
MAEGHPGSPRRIGATFAAPGAPAGLRERVGCAIEDLRGAPVGRLERVLPEAGEGEPTWLIVNEFRFGERRRFVVPAAGAGFRSGGLRVPYGRELIRRTAELAREGPDAEAQRRLRMHYLLRERAA